MNLGERAARLRGSPLVLAVCTGLVGGVGVAFLGNAISPMLGVAAVVAAGVTAYFLRFPTLALYALAFSVPVERFGRISDDTSAFTLSVTRGVGLLSLAALVPVLVMGRRRPFVNGPLGWWCAFVAVGLLTLTYTSDLTPGVRIAGGHLGNILFMFTVMNLAMSDSVEESRRRSRIAILLWLLASTLVALYSIYDWHYGSGQTGGIPISETDPQAGAQLAEFRWSTVWIDSAEKETLGGLSIRRSMGSTSHAAVFGINLIMTIPFFFYLIRHCASRWIKWVMWAGLAASMYCVLLTNTRATLALAVGILGLCVILRLVRITPVFIIGGIAAALAAPFFLPEDIFERVLDLRNYQTSKSQAMSIRLEYWGAGLRAIADHWVMGNGLANQRVVLDYLEHPFEGKSHMHNIYLQTLMDVGVFGWGLFLMFLASTVRCCTRARRIFVTAGNKEDADMLTSALVMMIGVLIYGLQVDVFFFPLKGWWMVLGLVYVMARHGQLLVAERDAALRTADAITATASPAGA